MMEISWKESEKLKALGIAVTDIWGQNYLYIGDEIFRISPQPSDNPEYEQSKGIN